MDVLRMFQIGVDELTSDTLEYTPRIQNAGIGKAEWSLLTQKEIWSPSQMRSVNSILAEALGIVLTMSGLPAVPLPGNYVAALICKLVAPCNRLQAAIRAPRSFDAVTASGLTGPIQIHDTSRETMIALVTAYSSGQFLPSYDETFDRQVRELIREEIEKSEQAQEARN